MHHMQPIIMRHPKPIVPRTLVLLLATGIIILALYTALISTLNNELFYRHISDPALQEQNTAVLEYLRGPLSGPNNLLFLNSAERNHMTDVKQLFDIAFIIALAAIGIIIGILGVFAGQRWWPLLDELLSRSLRACGWTILAVALFLVLASLLDFDRLWLLFHALFFPQGNWAFPASSTLIMLYPGAFFERFVLRWLLLISSFAIVALLLSYALDHLRRHDAFFTERFERSTQGARDQVKAPEGKTHKGGGRKKKR